MKDLTPLFDPIVARNGNNRRRSAISGTDWRICREIRLCLWLVAIFAMILLPGRGIAAARAVDLELVLAADISGSMDLKEATLQRQGFAHALRHPYFIEAIRRGRFGRIAITYVEWAGSHYQNKLVGWTEIADESSAAAFAKTLEKLEVETRSWTSISTVIAFAASSFHGNGYHGERRVIDISGDGPNNDGVDVVSARDRAVAEGITINGLPIINDRPSMAGYPPMPDLDLYYQDCVIGGAGAFMVIANGFDDFARAVLQKLVLEIAGQTSPVKLLRFVADVSRPLCNAGEMRRKKWGYDLMDDF
jgi:hypothetical protein